MNDSDLLDTSFLDASDLRAAFGDGVGALEPFAATKQANGQQRCTDHSGERRIVVEDQM